MAQARLTLETLAIQIARRQYHHVTALLGAGVSVAAGIPDFRTPGSGLYATCQSRYAVPFPEALFHLDYFRSRPEPFFRLAKNLLVSGGARGSAAPTTVHRLLAALAHSGRLHAVVTQNIDSLELDAGIPERLVHFIHGHCRTSRCIDCGTPMDMIDFRRMLHAEDRETIVCPHCGGLVKPDIVFYGQDLPLETSARSLAAIRESDLLFVIGTSLAVHPVAGFVSCVPADCTRVYINRENSPAFVACRGVHYRYEVGGRGVGGDRGEDAKDLTEGSEREVAGRNVKNATEENAKNVTGGRRRVKNSIEENVMSAVDESVKDVTEGNTNKGDATKRDAVEEDATKGDTNKRDTVKEDATKGDTNKRDTVKEDTTKRDAVKEDTVKEDATKGDTVKEDTTKRDAVKEDATKGDTVKEDTTKRDAVKEDATKGDTVKEDTTKRDAVKEDATKGDTVKEDTTKRDAVKEDATKGDTVKEDTTKRDAVKEDATKGDTVKEDTTKRDAVKEDATKGDTVKEDTTKRDAVKEDATKGDTVKEDTTKRDAVKEDATKGDTVKEDTTKMDTTKNNSNNIMAIAKNNSTETSPRKTHQNLKSPPWKKPGQTNLFIQGDCQEAARQIWDILREFDEEFGSPPGSL